MKVRLLTENQKKDLENTTFAPNSTFNPIQDKNNNWIISNEEVSQCANEECSWVKGLPEIDFEPKTIPFP